MFQQHPCSTLSLKVGFKGLMERTRLNQTLIMDKSSPRTAVIYARVSSENDRQDTTRQITDLRNYADRENIDVKNVFTEHVSGVKKIEERAVLQKCLDYCISNHINILLLSEISRLGRSTLQVLRSLEMLHEAKVSVYVQNLGVNSLLPDGSVNPMASIIITLLAEFASIERANITYRLNSGRKQYIANGGKLGRKTGYRKTDEEMREQYKTAISLLKRGDSVRAVAKLEGISHTTAQKIKNKFI